MKKYKRILLLLSIIFFVVGIGLYILKNNGYLLTIQGYLNFSLITAFLISSLIIGYLYLMIKCKLFMRIIGSVITVISVSYILFGLQNESVEWNVEAIGDYEIMTENHSINTGGIITFYKRENFLISKYIQSATHSLNNIEYHVENNLLVIEYIDEDNLIYSSTEYPLD